MTYNDIYICTCSNNKDLLRQQTYVQNKTNIFSNIKICFKKQKNIFSNNNTKQKKYRLSNVALLRRKPELAAVADPVEAPSLGYH